MKFIKICGICVSLCFFTNLVYAQSSMAEKERRNIERNAQTVAAKQRANELANRESALHSIEPDRDLDFIPNLELIQKQQIANNLKDLKEKSEKLFLLTRTLEEKNLREVINTANKLGKISKDLRKNLELKSKKDLERPLIQVDNSIEQIRNISTKINDLVSQVISAQTISSVDASQIEQTEKNLQEIENHINMMKLLASKK